MMLVHPKRRMKRGFVRFFMDSLLGPYTALTPDNLRYPVELRFRKGTATES
jgi:hypothetical protein